MLTTPQGAKVNVDIDLHTFPMYTEAESQCVMVSKLNNFKIFENRLAMTRLLYAS